MLLLSWPTIGLLEAVDCRIHRIYTKICFLWYKQESLSVSHQVTYEIVVADADTRASAFAVKDYFFGRNYLAPLLLLLTLL
eukprot:scaffold22145_cov107-Skeletonema_marinoi.AAC.3